MKPASQVDLLVVGASFAGVACAIACTRLRSRIDERRSIVGKRLLLVGDAAGLVSPLTAGGQHGTTCCGHGRGNIEHAASSVSTAELRYLTLCGNNAARYYLR